MKKLVLMLFVTVFLFSCVENKKETEDIIIYEVVKNGIKFERNYSSNEYVRIISDSMCLDTATLNSVVHEFGYDSIIVYFHVKGLSNQGEEYGMYMFGSTSVNFNAPKTKEEYILKKKISDIDNYIKDCEDFVVREINTSDDAASVESGFSSIRTKITEYSTDINSQVISKIKILKSKLSKSQSVCYPKIRNAYTKSLRSKLWSEDIDVRNSGKTITFTAGIFAANQNKKDMYEAVLPMLELYRFKKVIFKWYEYDDKYTYWNIESKEDKNIE